MEYAAALNLFSRFLQNSPSEEELKGLADTGAFSDFAAWACFSPPGGEAEDAPAPGPALENLAGTYGPESAARNDSEAWRALYLELHQDHLALFSGPTPQARPWESVWRERDQLLFGEQTDKVYHTYLDWGLLIDRFGHDPEDHLGLELAFLLYLLRLSDEEPDRRSKNGETPQAALESFLHAHVLPWAGQCLDKASACASSVFYRELPKLCRVMLLNLSKDIKGED